MTEKFGLKSNVVSRVQSVLEKHATVQKAVIYGSRAKGNFREGSDVDLTLFGDGISFTELGRILDEIDDLLLPYTFDLSVYHDLKNDEPKEILAEIAALDKESAEVLKKVRELV